MGQKQNLPEISLEHDPLPTTPYRDMLDARVAGSVHHARPRCRKLLLRACVPFTSGDQFMSEASGIAGAEREVNSDKKGSDLLIKKSREIPLAQDFRGLTRSRC